MRMSILGFALGVWWLQRQGMLPDWPAIGGLVGGVLACVAMAWAVRRRGLVLSQAACFLGALLAGFAWAAAFGQIRLADHLPAQNEGRNIRVTGVIAGLPQAYENGVRFEFEVESAEATVPSRLSLAWYRGWRAEEDDERHAAPLLRAGERWQLTVRLKRPHGNLNPHGFDYEAWLFERGVRATGYVRAADDNRRTEAFVPQPGYAVERLRERIRERYFRSLPEHDYAGVLVALAVGDQRAIDSGNRQTSYELADLRNRLIMHWKLIPVGLILTNTL